MFKSVGKTYSIFRRGTVSGTVPVHPEHVDTNEQVHVQCHVIILNAIEHFLYSSGTHLFIILLMHVYN